MKEEYKKYIFIIPIVCLTIFSLLYMKDNSNDRYEITSKEINQETSLEKEIDSKPQEDKDLVKEESEIIPVYVCGQVNKQDVYYLEHGSIIKDAITMAGGVTEEADVEALNLAAEIEKGLKIYVPKVGEKIDKNDNSYDNRVEGNQPLHLETGLININTANSQELMLLPGVGPVIAENIIDYRESSGGFNSVDDIINVPRIGQGTLDKRLYLCPVGGIL